MSKDIEWWSVAQTARFLRRSPGTLYNWHTLGIGPPYERDRISRRIRYNAALVRRWDRENNERRTETLLGDSPTIAKMLKGTGR